MVIKNNMDAKKSLNSLSKNSKALAKSLKKVSSGMKINSAEDDASGYAISEGMRVQIRALTQANSNTQNANSLLKVADGALSNTVDIMRTMKERAINAANDTNTDADRAIIQKELDQAIDQVNDNANTTFNGKIIFDGSADKKYSKEQTIVAALYTEWISNSLDMIKNGMGLDFANSKGVKEMGVYFSDEPAVSGGITLAYVTGYSGANGKTAALSMTVNMNVDAYGKLDENNVNGSIEGSSSTNYLDRTIVHELTHAVMASNIEGFAGLKTASLALTEGAAEVIHGIDDTRRGNIQTLAASKSSLNAQLGSGASGVEAYAAGYMMYRFMAHKSGSTAEETLTRFMTSLAGGSGEMTSDRLNAAVKAASGYDSYDDLVAAIGAAQDDANAVDSTGTKFLKDYCGIDLNNIDVGGITGSDAGGRVTKNAEDAVPEAGSTKYWTNPFEKESNIDGLTVKWASDIPNDHKAGSSVEWHNADIQIKGGMRFHTGTESSQNLFVALSNVDARAMGLMDDNNNTIKVTTQTKAEAAISQLDKSINRALNQLTTIGAIQSRLEYTAMNLTTVHENTTSAESTIRDADMAKEMTEYTKNNVLMQSAQSMLSQANQNSSAALSLLQ
jgi:flagellin